MAAKIRRFGSGPTVEKFVDSDANSESVTTLVIMVVLISYIIGELGCFQVAVKVRHPPVFQWIVDGVLAAQGRPTMPDHQLYLCDNNVKYIVTLTRERPRALLEIPGVFKVDCGVIFDVVL